MLAGTSLTTILVQQTQALGQGWQSNKIGEARPLMSEHSSPPNHGI